MSASAPTLARRMAAEAVGSATLVAIVAGSGIAAQRLSPNDIGIQLFENSTATVLGLAVLIVLFGPVSGAHFNPAVSLADWLAGRRHSTGLTGAETAAYITAQTFGAIAGAVLANLMFNLPAAQISTHHRVDAGHLLGEVVATAGLIALIFALARTGRTALAPTAVAAWIGAAYWFTSSTSFANPAVTVGRMFTDTFAGIAPTSAPGFIAAQLFGALIGLGLVALLYPSAPTPADDVVMPHSHTPD
ncbi:MIP/aquaporin family protein [Nocardia sp. CDC153]|uniref:MIP/aquaporin family protein n=1 Tax=Nocardia sp. CDC153 TaxID=3112167 RepID=UPI002DBA6A9E|nr:MIP/aquaporin family protein [Nocardia sp. CDC153]MEC3957161.1 MIP/aquaporin family protein [Nocardia sp. CDC153]